MVVGGQMMQTFAVEFDVRHAVRPTDDVDVVVDVRSRPGATEWLANWLLGQGFELDGVRPEGIGHRFLRPATGAGAVNFDILAPEGLGDRTSIFTVLALEGQERSGAFDGRTFSARSLARLPPPP